MKFKINKMQLKVLDKEMGNDNFAEVDLEPIGESANEAIMLQERYGKGWEDGRAYGYREGWEDGHRGIRRCGCTLGRCCKCI